MMARLAAFCDCGGRALFTSPPDAWFFRPATHRRYFGQGRMNSKKSKRT
jgi:hypothetical protein